MAIKSNMRGGSGAGRGDNAHYEGTGPVKGTDGQVAGGNWGDPERQAAAHYEATRQGSTSPGGRTPQETAQRQYDQHTIAHADGFIGPRIGEAYGASGQGVDRATMKGLAPTSKGGMQPSPSFGRVYGAGSADTAGRMGHLDNVVPETKPRMMQHKETGNLIEVQKMHEGDRVNDYGTDAKGQSMQPREDYNMNPGGRYGKGIDHTSDDYTDVSDVIRSTETYKTRKQRPS
jgi:hypothetical protein